MPRANANRTPEALFMSYARLASDGQSILMSHLGHQNARGFLRPL